MKLLFYTIFIYFLQSLVTLAQGEANIWYFGAYAGIDFSKGNPKVLLDGKLNTVEGCATICDSEGNLLFYTDGIKIWNKNHTLMKNGEGLLGNDSSTQSAIIVQKPNQKNLYYVFTVDVAKGTDGLNYSVVDINLNQGNGEVIEKNKQLITPTSEKVTAVRHKNNKDIWIISHYWGNNQFATFLLTEKGIENKPVISAIGEEHSKDSDNAIGYMKTSPDGKKLAVAIKGLNMYELFDFDNETGKISNPIQLKVNEKGLAYGVEFSSDGTKLYGSVGNFHSIYQYDLNAKNIDASAVLIGETDGWAGALQMGPDGKIYVSEYGAKALSYIEFPNKLGKDCNYMKHAVDLGGKHCQLGLPTFVQTYFEDIENLQKITSESGKQIKFGESFVKVILFDFNQYNIKPEYYATLNELVDYLKKSPKVKISITGHTDSDGTDQQNLLLSQNRSKSVADYIIAKGINKERVSFKGVGKNKPIVPNTTPENKAKNRRIEFVLIKN
jgi:outer membrane protein OmpA-like peptidoglycan-associated protein